MRRPPGGWQAPPKPKQPCLRKRCADPRKALGLCAKHYHVERQRRVASAVRPNTVQLLPSSASKWVRPEQDGACNRCGSPTMWGACAACTPELVLHTAVPVLVEHLPERFYSGRLHAIPSKRRASGRSIR